MRSGICGLVALACVLFTAAPVRAQAAPDAPDPAQAGVEMIRLSFPDDTNLKTLADFVAKRLELNLIYDSKQLATRQLTIKTTVEIPLDSLMDLFSGALGVHSLALKQTDVPGTLQVVSAAQLVTVPSAITQGTEPGGEHRGGQVISRVFTFEHALAASVDAMIKPFLTTPGATSLVIAEQNLLIVNDYASNMRRVAELMALADRPSKTTRFEMVPVQHLDATDLASRVSEVLAGQARARGLGAANPRVSIVAEPASNALVVFAPAEALPQTLKLIASLDTHSSLTTEVYRLRVAEATRVDEVMVGILGEGVADRLYRSVPDEGTNELVVTTTPAIHERIGALVEKIDQPRAVEESPIRFYKLKNADAQELLATLQGVVGQRPDNGAEAGSDAGVPDDLGTGRLLDAEGRVTSAAPATTPRAPGSADQITADAAADLADARLIADEATNTIIVIARPSVQPLYERLIKQLDVRLPQVLLSATIVAIDTTDDFSLGVEFSRGDAVDGGSLLNFTQFGLSTVDAATGDLTLAAATGLNAALLDAGAAEVILQALQSDSRSTIVTSPQILVNDNEQGELSSEDEEPIETNVLSDGTSQASFGGYATAGTSISVTPSISEGDYLKLDYDIEVSTFAATRVSESLPPARQTNRLNSIATVPDGSTVIVGGLTREVDSESVSSIPFLGRIPVLRHAFSNTSQTTRQVTLFIFLKPVILRDDKFQDLKVLSGSAAGRANLPAAFPKSLPVEIR